MTDNELLIALSDMMDSKLKPLHDRMKKVELTLENDMLPRVQNIEACYTSTFKRYANGVEQIEGLQMDVDILKKIVLEHSEKIKQIS